MTEKDVKRAISNIEVPSTLKGDVSKAVTSAQKPKLSYAKKRMLVIASVLVLCLAVTGVAIPVVSARNYGSVALATAKDIEKIHITNIRKTCITIICRWTLRSRTMRSSR
jgi:hypothetical protein